MPSQPLSVFEPAAYGCNTADEPVLFTERNTGRFVQLTGNMRVHNNRWRTAYRWRELAGHGEDFDLWAAGHTQNAIWYLPRAGQGTNYIGVGVPRIVESSAGRLFTLTPKNGVFEVLDVSGGNVSYPWLMLSWLCQGENYVIRTDGKSQTQIWDGKNPVFFSTGYNSNAKTQARFPNFAGPTVYAGGRFYTVLFGRRIYASDSLHQLNLVGATDLLKFTDQTYDYINVYFSPPSDDGDITALTVSINSGFNDSRAQGEVLAMCDGPSIWAVRLGVPRQQWPTADMRHARSKETAACGPNAFAVRDGDILMRTPLGVESINLLARFQQTLGNPTLDLGADMKAILDRDDEQSLMFASLINPPKWNRMFCTVSPQIRGARHWHKGWITANFNPLGQRIPQGFAWEGLGTLPSAMGKVIQFLEARYDGRSHVMALLDKGDGTGKGLAELTHEEGPNVLADGTQVPIQWFILSRRLAPGGPVSQTPFHMAWIKLEDALGDIEIQVWARADVHPQFKLRTTFKITALPAPGDIFGCGKSAERILCLGKIVDEFVGSSWTQFLVKGRGTVTANLLVSADEPTSPGEKPDPECVFAESPPVCDFDMWAEAV